jgi:hypothetical protein
MGEARMRHLPRSYTAWLLSVAMLSAQALQADTVPVIPPPR